MKVSKVRKLLTGNITNYARYVNVAHPSIYRWKDLPKKYYLPTIEFLEMLATDMQEAAHQLALEVKNKSK